MCIKKINNKLEIVLKSDKAKNVVLAYLYSNTVRAYLLMLVPFQQRH